MKMATYTLAMAALLAFPTAGARAQQSASTNQQTGDAQTDSLAAAARAAREQKHQKPAVKVWDNDNVPKEGGVNVVGSEAPAASTAADANAVSGQPAANANGTAPAGSGSGGDKASMQADLDAAKKQLDDLKGDLDIQQRKYALDQQSYYGKTNYEDDKEGAASLQSEKEQIDAKQQQADDLQKKIDDLSGKVGASAEQPPASQPQ